MPCGNVTSPWDVQLPLLKGWIQHCVHCVHHTIHHEPCTLNGQSPTRTVTVSLTSQNLLGTRYVCIKTPGLLCV